MIYRNDNLIFDNESVKGTIEDLMEYFRYELARQCMSIKFEEIGYENFLVNAKDIIDVISNLKEDLENNIFAKNDIMLVYPHPMGGFVIEKGI